MNRFMNKRLTELEKLVVVTEEPIPRIEPWMTVEQVMEIWAQALRHHNSLPPAFTAREIEEACKGMTHEELADYWARTCQETWDKVRREKEAWERAKADGLSPAEFVALRDG